ncbi:hypothetical protein MSG28_000250 [Choristoneura fumiferana]|uniref:Uncharacterized protein n=1 Tax=Choristoneura fumiferana TaxID=7141 RepID=A0ACC0K0G2_CHOFU|nr:hypothetical protein MSG28_000250 [Choristoneura fumiferana]
MFMTKRVVQNTNRSSTFTYIYITGQFTPIDLVPKSAFAFFFFSAFSPIVGHTPLQPFSTRIDCPALSSRPVLLSPLCHRTIEQAVCPHFFSLAGVSTPERTCSTYGEYKV